MFLGQQQNTSLASSARLTLTTVMILLDERRIRIEAIEAYLLGSPVSLNNEVTLSSGIQF